MAWDRQTWAPIASAPPAEGGPAPTERRANPMLRPTVQAAFDRLLAVLQKAGRADVLKPLDGRERVDDILRECPGEVPTLLELAWQLRETSDFRGFFRRSGGETTVQARNQAIDPCALTYDQIVRAHLYGAARLVFERRERAWAQKRAQREKVRRQRRKEQEQARGNLQSRLMAPLKTMLESEQDIDPEQFRSQYPGHGLYLILKPYLQEPWQFRFVETYARLGSAQARALGHLITRIRDPDVLDTVVGLSIDDIGLVRTVCRAFGEIRLNLDLPVGPRWQLSAADLKTRTESEDRLSVIESITFDVVLLEHTAALDTILSLGMEGRSVVRRLTPIFADDLWSVMESPAQIENTRRVPDHLLPVLGPLSRYCPPETSVILGHIRDHALARDLMAFARETFSDEELVRYLADPDRRPIWNTLPAKFNNAYRYQRDAVSGGSLHNSDDLRTVSSAIFQSLRLGQVENF